MHSNRHAEYRLELVEHLITNTLVHWDQSMRLLGAQSLRAVCELDLTVLGPLAEGRLVSHFPFTEGICITDCI